MLVDRTGAVIFSTEDRALIPHYDKQLSLPPKNKPTATTTTTKKKTPKGTVRLALLGKHTNYIKKVLTHCA